MIFQATSRCIALQHHLAAEDEKGNRKTSVPNHRRPRQIPTPPNHNSNDGTRQQEPLGTRYKTWTVSFYEPPYWFPDWFPEAALLRCPPRCFSTMPGLRLTHDISKHDWCPPSCLFGILCSFGPVVGILDILGGNLGFCICLYRDSESLYIFCVGYFLYVCYFLHANEKGCRQKYYSWDLPISSNPSGFPENAPPPKPLFARLAREFYSILPAEMSLILPWGSFCLCT